MKQLILFLTMLLSVPFVCSCDKDTVEDKGKNSEKEQIYGDIIYTRKLYINNGVDVDTLCYAKDNFEIELEHIQFRRGAEVDALCGIDICEDYNQKKDTLITIGNNIIGRVEYKDFKSLEKIEVYNWFTISAIKVDGKQAYEIRTTGPAPDNVWVKIQAYDHKYIDGTLYLDVNCPITSDFIK